MEWWLCLGLALTAGICEELVYRGALLHIVERVLPGTSLVLAAAIAVGLFGIAHAYQGVKGVVGTTVLGAVFMAVFLGSGRLLPAMVLHALVDLKLVFMRAPDAAVAPGSAQLEH